MNTVNIHKREKVIYLSPTLQLCNRNFQNGSKPRNLMMFDDDDDVDENVKLMMMI